MKFLFPTLSAVSLKVTRRAPRFLFAATAASVFAVTPALVGQLEATAPEAEEVAVEEGSRVLGVIRTPAPKELTERILSVARKLMPGPQTEALPFMLGGMLGDPTLEGVSPSENLGIVFIEKGGEVQPVFVFKLTENSPLRQSLPNMDFRLHDSGEWTFALKEGITADWIQGSESELISAVREKRRYDLELTAAAPVLAQKLREAAAEFPQMGGVDDLFIRPLLHGLAGEADSVDDMRIGLDLSAETIRQVFFLKAISDTPLAAFLDQGQSQDFDFAKFIPGTDPMIYLGGFSVEATKRYFEHFFRNFEDEAGEQAELLQDLNKVGMRFLESTDGRSGGGISFQDAKMLITQVAPSTFTTEELAEMLKESARTMEHLNFQEELGYTQTHELLLNHLEVDGIPVHVFRTEIQVAGEQPEYPDLGEQRQDMLYALVDGYLVSTTTVSQMAGLISSIQNQEPVENNLASMMNLAPGQVFAFQIDLPRYFGSLGAMLPGDFALITQNLQEQNLAPLTGRSTATDGVSEFEVAVPVDTVAAIYQAIMQQMTAQHPVPAMPQE